MNIVIVLIILLLLFGGGGFYLGGPMIGGSLGGLILLILIVMLLTGKLGRLEATLALRGGTAATRPGRCRPTSPPFLHAPAISRADGSAAPVRCGIFRSTIKSTRTGAARGSSPRSASGGRFLRRWARARCRL